MHYNLRDSELACISRFRFEALEIELENIYRDIFKLAQNCGDLNLMAWTLNEIWHDVRNEYLPRERALSI